MCHKFYLSFCLDLNFQRLKIFVIRCMRDCACQAGKLYSEGYYALFENVSKQFRKPIQYHSKTRPCCMAFSQMLPYGSCIKWNDSGSITFGLCFGIFCGMSLKSIWENISWDVQGKTKIGKMWVSEWRGWPLILLMRLGVGGKAALVCAFNSLPGCRGSESLGLGTQEIIWVQTDF